jgi:1,4-dihydroxy-2-naphthoate octaprenyltransferase
VPAVLAFTTPAGRWLLLPWLTLPLGIALMRRVGGTVTGRELNPMLGRTGQLLLAFGVLLAAGLVLGRG